MLMLEVVKRCYALLLMTTGEPITEIAMALLLATTSRDHTDREYLYH